MRSLLILSLLIHLGAAQADEPCVEHAPAYVRLTGTLVPVEIEIDSVDGQTEALELLMLRLDEEICIAANPESSPNLERLSAVDTVAFMFGCITGEGPKWFRSGNRVTVTGRLYDVRRTWGHTDAMITVAGIEPSNIPLEDDTLRERALQLGR